MDPIENPFSPGAGSPPPEMVGRDSILEQAAVLLGRTKAGRSEKSPLLTGLRGIGKTVLLGEIEWGYQSWNLAPASPITLQTVRSATAAVVPRIDANFFRVRFDRLTPGEKSFLRVMAALGPGPHRTGDIADRLGVKVTSLGPLRARLIQKGMVYSPANGEMAFTVPLFDEFMIRAMPDPGR